MFRPRSVSVSVSLMILGAVLLLLSPPTSLAATGPPVPAVCDQEDSGERIKCKTKNVLDQRAASVEMMGQMPGMSDAQMQRLDRMVGRGRNAEGRTPNRDFKELTKKRAEKCRIVPADPNDADGIGDAGSAGPEGKFPEQIRYRPSRDARIPQHASPRFDMVRGMRDVDR